MKRAVLISISILMAHAPALAHGKSDSYNVLLAGGSEPNTIQISLSADGRSYTIDSAVPLEVGGNVCQNPPGNPYELVCRATMVSGFEVNAGSGDDSVTVAKDVRVPVTMRGGGGNDTLTGGAGPDKLLGGEGDDRLVGNGGPDLLYGGPGNDKILGGWSNDLLRGGPGEDLLAGGPGDDDAVQ